MRQPKPYLKKTHRCYYVNLRGKTIRLDPDKEKAWTLYHKLMGGEQPAPEKGYTVLELMAQFLDYSKRKHKERTHEWYKLHLKSFYEHVGSLQVKSLKPFHVEGWVAKRYKHTTNGNTIGGAMRCVQRMMNWAVKSGRIDRSPLVGLEKPAQTPRDAYLTPEQFEALLKKVKDSQFRDFLNILRHTGCRPQEARLIEVRHFDRKERCWVFPPDEAKGGKEERVVHLDAVAFEITERWANKVKDGVLFRNARGEPWTRNALKCRCNRLAEKLGFDVTCYTVRHTFATDSIIRGVDLITIAKLMGHKDLRMLQRVYSKVGKRSDHLRAALRKATGEDEAA